MTPGQLERKARQLLYRRRLADTVESLEDSIKVFMEAKKKNKVVTKSFIVRLTENEVHVTLLPKHNPRQLKLRFKREAMREIPAS